MTETSVPPPDAVSVQVDPRRHFVPTTHSHVRVDTSPVGLGRAVVVHAPRGVARVALRWTRPIPRSTRVLADAWERAYGDLEWRVVRPEAALPWCASLHDTATGRTDGIGVEVRAGAFAFWQVDDAGITLVLDLRSGGAAVQPGDRPLAAATVRWSTSDAGSFPAHCELMDLLCSDPLDAGGPLVGANNWYYAYGRDFGLASVVRDARAIVELSDGHPVIPFGVIDDGWSIDGTADGLEASAGPWNRGRPREFPDMAEAAAALRGEGVRPGVWFRPLLTRDAGAEGIRAARDGAWALDPSAPAVRETVAADFARFAEWGYDLVKHDFSTYDLLGRWGPQFGAAPADGPALHDPGMTTAEALVDFYRTAVVAAGDTLVLGCNVVGHLAAGLVHAQRIGDDTSGLDWNRTRRVGVNTLAFRLAQHGTFFTADADCVVSTPMTDWALDRQFLDLVARSGTALFVSLDPRTRTRQVDDDIAAALKLALDGGEPGGIHPLDWMDTPTPTRWRAGDEVVEYDWLRGTRADPFEPTTAASPPP